MRREVPPSKRPSRDSSMGLPPRCRIGQRNSQGRRGSQRGGLHLFLHNVIQQLSDECLGQLALKGSSSLGSFVAPGFDIFVVDRCRVNFGEYVK